MKNGKSIFIVSTSKAIAELTSNYLKESGAQDYSVLAIENDEELKACLQKIQVEYLFIEGSFYHEATPGELLRITKKHLNLRIYVFDYHENADYFLKSVLRAGADGFLDMRKEKSALIQDFELAITGQGVIPKQFKGMNLEYHPMQTCKLTNRDMEFVHLITCGYENKEIARFLHLGLQSVKNRRKAIYEKLHATNSIDFLRQAIIKGVVELDEFLHR
jgi:DNA-binding NarL/FixJ family response regulator